MSAKISPTGVTNTIINYITSAISVPSASLNNGSSSAFYLMTGSGTSFTLPAASTFYAGWNITVKNNSAGLVTIVAPANSLDGQTSVVLNPFNIIQIVGDGVATYSILNQSSGTASIKRLFTLGATSIVDGVPSFARANILSSTSGLTFAVNDSGFIQATIPTDYVAGSSLDFVIDYVPRNVLVGTYEWYLYWAALAVGDIIIAAPTPPTLTNASWNGATLSQVSPAVINQKLTLTFTLPSAAPVIFSAGKTLLFKFIKTSGPTLDVLAICCNYLASY